MTCENCGEKYDVVASRGLYCPDCELSIRLCDKRIKKLLLRMSEQQHKSDVALRSATKEMCDQCRKGVALYTDDAGNYAHESSIRYQDEPDRVLYGKCAASPLWRILKGIVVSTPVGDSGFLATADGSIVVHGGEECRLCCNCGKWLPANDVRLAPDPYDLEMYDYAVPVWECENCRTDRMADI